MEFMVATTANGMDADHRLLVTPLGDAGGRQKSYTVSQNVTLYADSDTDVVFYVESNSPGSGAMRVSVSGYLSDLN